MPRIMLWLAVLTVAACGCTHASPPAPKVGGAGQAGGGAQDLGKQSGGKHFLAGVEKFAFDFTLPDTEGKTVSLADYKGKVLIVDFWGTWCGPCKMEIPHFIELKKRYGDQGFDIVGINYENGDADEAKQLVADFVKENGINYTCVIGDETTQSQVPKLSGYPTTLFVDRAGKVRQKVEGYHELADLEAIVTELLAEAAPDEQPADKAAGETDDEAGNADEPMETDDETAPADDEPPAPINKDAEADSDAEPKSPEPGDDKEAADEEQPPAGLDAAADQLLQKAQQLAQKQDIDGMLRVLKQAQKLHPENRQVLTVLCRVLAALAAQDIDEERADAAYAKYREAAVYARTLRDKFPALSANERLLVVGLLYNEACAYGVADRADDALASLKEAVEAGFAGSEQLANDSDLALLHDRPEFEELKEQVAKNAQEQTQEEAELERAADEQALADVKRQFAKGETFPFDFKLPDLDDKPVALADFKGKVLIVDIWGTWCPPCRAEVPHFIELKKRYGDKGFDIVGINYEDGDLDAAKQAIADFIKENGLNYTCVLGDEETQNQVPNLEGYPTTLFIDRAGKVRLKLVGLQPLTALEWVVEQLVSEEPPAGDENDEPSK